jgi:hypothetical protein
MFSSKKVKAMASWLESHPQLLFLILHMDMMKLGQANDLFGTAFIDNLLHTLQEDAVANHGYQGSNLAELWNEKIDELSGDDWDPEAEIRFIIEVYRHLYLKHVNQVTAKTKERYARLETISDFRQLADSSLYSLSQHEAKRIGEYMRGMYSQAQIGYLQQELRNLVAHYGESHPIGKQFAEFIIK